MDYISKHVHAILVGLAFSTYMNINYAKEQRILFRKVVLLLVTKGGTLQSVNREMLVILGRHLMPAECDVICEFFR